jgi:predicted amidohydrolase
MSSGKIKVATCQFAVSASIGRNARQIKSYLHKAKKLKAELVHFPECALSGYVGTDFPNFDSFNWEQLIDETKEIMSLIKKLGLWVVLGSTHRLTAPNKPHNSLYLINPEGKIVDR